jgi:DNA adenine methylase
MQYLGGKFRIKDKIASIINGLEGDMYVEPFCGACWVGAEVNKPVRIFSDVNKYLIAMWQEVQKGWSPPWKVTEEEYNDIRDDYRANGSRYPDYLKGFVGFAGSYGGKFWGGYARDPNSNRNYIANASASLVKLIPRLETAKFIHQSYSQVFGNLMKLSQKVVVYCDPPYEGTTKYYGVADFDHVGFWHNVKVVSSKHYVLVSSYDGPFTSIAEFETRLDMNGLRETRVERLYGTGLILDDYDWSK